MSHNAKELLTPLKRHPIFLLFGLLNSLSEKYGDLRKGKYFYNIHDVYDAKRSKYFLNPNVEMHLIFIILFNMFVPNPKIENVGQLNHVYNGAYKDLYKQCVEMVQESRKCWFNISNINILKAGLRFFSPFPGTI
jgi:hypothetical protein